MKNSKKIRSKYLGKKYNGWKVIKVFTNPDTRHTSYTLKKNYRTICLRGDELLRVIRHKTTIKKLLNY